MEFTVAEIAKLLNGEVKGNPDIKVSKLAKIEEGGEGTITFLSNKKYESYLYTTSSSVVVVNRSFLLEKEVNSTLILVDDAYQAFIVLLKYYNEVKNSKTGIEKSVAISDTATLGENIYLGSFAYIGENVKIADGVKIYPHVYIGDNSKIGKDTILYSGAKLYSETEIGANCVIHANAVLGSDGFGFAPKEDGTYEKVPQIGNVIIEDNVEIGVGTTIDRATMGSTIIKKGVKIDNLVQIAHNVQIGENTVIASQCGIAGSTKIGENTMIGGQAGIVGHINIGNQVQIQAQSGVNHDIADGEKVYGSPAMMASDYRRAYVYFRKLPDIVKRIEELENNINNNK